jgi:transposase
MRGRHKQRPLQQDMGRSRGGLTSKIHAVVDTNGLPVHLALTPGEVHDNRLCLVLLSALLPQTMLLADRGYDADWIRVLARQQGAWANIPPKRNRKDPICFSPYLYRARNLIERVLRIIQVCSCGFHLCSTALSRRRIIDVFSDRSSPVHGEASPPVSSAARA